MCSLRSSAIPSSLSSSSSSMLMKIIPTILLLLTIFLWANNVSGAVVSPLDNGLQPVPVGPSSPNWIIRQFESSDEQQHPHQSIANFLAQKRSPQQQLEEVEMDATEDDDEFGQFRVDAQFTGPLSAADSPPNGPQCFCCRAFVCRKQICPCSKFLL